ncbi:probable endochitinase [Wyeomyia smithii]|uniref:probable endochitinase n=1 Tax=Wyeomyia smithii TaxID=174621 RepID=UPI002467D703|nr:probable endochitinase [Wyeomyia smithii]
MKSFQVHTLLVVVLLSRRISAQEALSPADSLCDGITYATLPNPHDCRSYYVCLYSKVFNNTCPPNFVFQPSVSFCVHRTQYPCLDSETTTSSPTSTSTSLQPSEAPEENCPETSWEAQFCRIHISALISNPFNCTQYINCEVIPSRNLECPPGRVFSLPYQDCFPGSPVTCSFNPVEASFCTDKPTGSYAHPYQCNRFVTCFRGEPRVETCPPYYLFDSAALRCVRGDVRQCSSLLTQ